MRYWLSEESGQGMVEYALILAFIALIAVAALPGIGQKLISFFEDAISQFPN